MKPPEMAAAYETALSKFDRAEDNMRNILAERRNKKLARLIPHVHKDSSHLHTHKVTHTQSHTHIQPTGHNAGEKDAWTVPCKSKKRERTKSCRESSHTIQMTGKDPRQYHKQAYPSSLAHNT